MQHRLTRCVILLEMRFRQRISSIEFVAAILPFAEGIHRLLRPRPNANPAFAHYYPWFLIAVSVLVVVRHFTNYVDLAPRTLEYRAMWHHQSIPYIDIERIVPVVNPRNGADTGVTDVYAGAAKLSLIVANPADFIAQLRQNAPQAQTEEPATA